MTLDELCDKVPELRKLVDDAIMRAEDAAYELGQAEGGADCCHEGDKCQCCEEAVDDFAEMLDGTVGSNLYSLADDLEAVARLLRELYTHV